MGSNVLLALHRYSFSFVSANRLAVRKPSSRILTRLVYVRDRRCRVRCVVRVNLAGHSPQYLVWGRDGILPLCARILECGLSAVARAVVVADTGIGEVCGWMDP
jgi:hypothetical protein